MKIAIIGCGWVGEKLARFLSAKGHYVIVTTTSVEKTERLKEISAELHLLDFARNSETDFLNDVEITIFSMPISRDGWLEGFKKIGPLLESEMRKKIEYLDLEYDDVIVKQKKGVK